MKTLHVVFPILSYLVKEYKQIVITHAKIGKENEKMLANKSLNIP
jgi:hypothetical protein